MNELGVIALLNKQALTFAEWFPAQNMRPVGVWSYSETLSLGIGILRISQGWTQGKTTSETNCLETLRAPSELSPGEKSVVTAVLAQGKSEFRRSRSTWKVRDHFLQTLNLEFRSFPTGGSFFSKESGERKLSFLFAEECSFSSHARHDACAFWFAWIFDLMNPSQLFVRMSQLLCFRDFQSRMLAWTSWQRSCPARRISLKNSRRKLIYITRSLMTLEIRWSPWTRAWSTTPSGLDSSCERVIPAVSGSSSLDCWLL